MFYQKRNRKHEWNNLFFIAEMKRDILLFYFDVIQRRLLSALIQGFGDPKSRLKPQLKGLRTVKKLQKDNI